MTEKYRISIVICTYNRSQYLSELIGSLENQRGDVSGTCEIVIVDNNSSDDTENVVHDLKKKSRWPIRYIRETKQGVGYARNAGVKASLGEIIAYLDDDVLADERWLESMLSVFDDGEVDVVGGRIERLWESPEPVWYSEEIGAPLISQNFGPDRRPLEGEKSYMLNANLAFRASVFERCGIFRGELGRRGNVLIGGEEPEMFRRLHAAGVKIVYDPGPVVKHRVEQIRLTKEYMRDWFWGIGRTRGHQSDVQRSHALTIAPLWVWSEVGKGIIRYLFSRLGDERERFAAGLWLRYHVGYLYERFLLWLPWGLGKSATVFA